MKDQFFDEAAWRVACHQCAAEAIRRAGLSETLFVQNLYRKVQARLRKVASAHRARALAIASEVGYLNEAEPNTDAPWNTALGYCSHGIPWSHCPMGCENTDFQSQDNEGSVEQATEKQRAHQ